jgi:hypothetical protein
MQNQMQLIQDQQKRLQMGLPITNTNHLVIDDGQDTTPTKQMQQMNEKAVHSVYSHQIENSRQ